MEIKRSFILCCLYFSIAVGGCRFKNEFDAPYYAKMYCDCLDRQEGQIRRNVPQLPCDSLVESKSRFYKLYHSQFSNFDEWLKLSASTKDSIQTFMTNFSSFVDENCREYFSKKTDSLNPAECRLK